MRRSPSRGFTLIELMVATVVGALAILAITQGFISLNRIVEVEDSIRAGHASARQAMQQISTELRSAGYGLEPEVAFGFPTGWRRNGPNQSDTLVFHARSPLFRLEVASGGAAANALTINTVRTPLRSPLSKGQIVQVVCPGAAAWSYGELAADVAPGAATLPLVAATGEFPRLNGRFAESCFGGMPGIPAYIFKVETYAYSIEQVEVAPDVFRAYLVRTRGGIGEPVAEDIEALRVTFMRADGQAFIPNPDLPAPTYDTDRNDALRLNDSPANIRTIRVGIVARSSRPDQPLRQAGQGNVIPGFAGVADLELPGDPKVVGGYRRFIFETSVGLRNLASTAMFLPPYTSDTATENVCRGVAPSDGLNCAGG